MFKKRKLFDIYTSIGSLVSVDLTKVRAINVSLTDMRIIIVLDSTNISIDFPGDVDGITEASKIVDAWKAI